MYITFQKHNPTPIASEKLESIHEDLEKDMGKRDKSLVLLNNFPWLTLRS